MPNADKATDTDLTVTSTFALPDGWPGASDPGDARCHVFQTREFIHAWQESYGKSGRHTAIFVEVLAGDGSLMLQIPFCLEIRGGLKVLTFLDQGHADYNCPVFHPAAPAWSKNRALALWREIAGAVPEFDIAFLEKIAPGIDGYENPLFLITDTESKEFCHGNDLTKPWADIEATQFNLKTLKRYGRRLEEMGKTRLVIAGTLEDGREMLDRLIIQKQRRFEETLVPTFDQNPTSLEFLYKATDGFGRSGNLFLVGLYVGEEPAAITWGLTMNRCLYSLVMGFEDGIWRKYSSGRILNLRLLEWLKENGFEYLDHGFGNEDYKVRSCDTTVILKEAILPETARGKAHIIRRNAIARIKATALWQKLRPLKWKLKYALRSLTGKKTS